MIWVFLIVGIASFIAMFIYIPRLDLNDPSSKKKLGRFFSVILGINLLLYTIYRFID